MAQPRVLLSGGTGFLRRYVAEALSEGALVMAVTRQVAPGLPAGVQLHRADVTRLDVPIAVDVLVHLAAATRLCCLRASPS